MNKKQLIMEKALELFAKQGFEATSVQQITELCGISKGAFYLSFKTKDELILALIDHFMRQFTSDIDYLVKSSADDTELLYEFYYTAYDSFLKHSDFAKILVKEQMHSFNSDLIMTIREYDQLFAKNILAVVERLYGDVVLHTKYDLMYCIKGFIGMYSELFLFTDIPVDLDLLARSLVEKTNLLAAHTTIPFISKELIQLSQGPLREEKTKEQLIDILHQTIDEVEDSIEKDSLVLLRQHLIEPVYSPAILKGLLENLRNHPHCKWISYQLRNHLEQ